MVLAVGMTITSSIGQFWPWLVTLVVYGMVVGVTVGRMRVRSLQIFLIVVATAGPTIYMLTLGPWGWTTAFGALFVGAVCFATSGSLCSIKSVHVAALLAGVQTMWVGPSALMFYNYTHLDPSAAMFPLIAALVGAISAFYVADNIV
ncbi:MAG: hypothetical protein JWP06_1102 [Candidatus Saccharibacteria bacterium]|nr:hypothetical protein [Candidatus Saccharibacteria bacterium]